MKKIKYLGSTLMDSREVRPDVTRYCIDGSRAWKKNESEDQSIRRREARQTLIH